MMDALWLVSLGWYTRVVGCLGSGRSFVFWILDRERDMLVFWVPSG